MQQVKPDSVKKGNPPYRILSLDTGGVSDTQKLFLNAFLNHCVYEAYLPKIFNY